MLRPSRRTPPRLVRFRGFFDRRAEPAMRSAFEDAVRGARGRGGGDRRHRRPRRLRGSPQDHRIVMAAEAAASSSDWLDEFPDDYPPRIRELIQEGRTSRPWTTCERGTHGHGHGTLIVASCRRRRFRCRDHSGHDRYRARPFDDRRSGLQFPLELHRPADRLVPGRAGARRNAARDPVRRRTIRDHDLLAERPSGARTPSEPARQ